MEDEKKQNIFNILKYIRRSIYIFIVLFFFLYGFQMFYVHNTYCVVEFEHYTMTGSIISIEHRLGLDRYRWGLIADTSRLEGLRDWSCSFELGSWGSNRKENMMNDYNFSYLTKDFNK